MIYPEDVFDSKIFKWDLCFWTLFQNPGLCSNLGFKSLQNNSAWFLKLGSYFSVMSELRSLKGSPPQIIRNGIVLCKIIYVRGQVLANARSFIQRMWLIPRSLSGIYVFGHCSKIWMSFPMLVPKFHIYYLGSKSSEGLFCVPKVWEF